ncbi:MAG: hypothetical protein GEU94_18555 [Micromonosporaceae bacterium]|nr:hypothetical protein [Micromonosporaceae bacterium]
MAAALSDLSAALWRCYTHPASAADSMDVNTEGWRRQRTRDGFSNAIAVIRTPNLPSDRGDLVVSYDPVEERAHRLGRTLHQISDPAVTDAVLVDIEAELKAVELAELGDLSGRAAQAVLLTREDASPVQVVAADQVLTADPLGGSELLLRFDPTAASVAAAHWLQAAADVVAEMWDGPAVEVVEEADNIAALPHATPTAVLELMELGLTPRRAVTYLIRNAMAIAAGVAIDLDDLEDRIAEVRDLAHRRGGSDPDPEQERIRLTPLDPQRPARDLLEDLLTGISGCRLLYAEYADLPATDGADVEDDEDLDERFDALLDEQFSRLVRARAAADRSRLL